MGKNFWLGYCESSLPTILMNQKSVIIVSVSICYIIYIIATIGFPTGTEWIKPLGKLTKFPLDPGMHGQDVPSPFPICISPRFQCLWCLNQSASLIFCIHYNTFTVPTRAKKSEQQWTHTHTLRFNGHSSRWTWVSRLPVAPLILFLHLFLDCASFWDRPKLSMSFLPILPGLFGCPHCLIPSTSHVIRLTQSLSSFRSTSPNHLNLLFLIIKLTGSNPKSSLSSSLFFLSFSLTPHIHLIILTSSSIHAQMN